MIVEDESELALFETFADCVRLQPGGLKKLAVHGAIVMVGTTLSQQSHPAFVDYSCAKNRELLAQGCVRATRCNAIQVRRKYAEFFGVHDVTTNDGRVVCQTGTANCSTGTEPEGPRVKYSG